MKRFHLIFLVGFSIFCASANLVQGQKWEREAAKEEPFLQELQKIAPKAVVTFKAATKSLDNGENDEAIRQYNEVLKQAPTFEPALRRLGYALVEIGKYAEGVAAAQKAVDLHRSADNLLGLSVVIVSPGNDNYLPPDSEVIKALTLAEEASKLSNGSDPDALSMIAQLSLALNRTDVFNSSVRQLREKFPNLIQTHYYDGIKRVNDGDLDGGIIEIKKAEELGLPHEEAALIVADIEKFKEESRFFGYGAYLKYIYLAGILIALWAVGLALLFLVGKILSKRTLVSIENSDRNDITGGGQAGLRRFYRKVITIAGLYYYVSQPFVILLVIAVTVAITLFFLAVGTIPVKLLFIFAFVGLATIFYMIKSLVFRAKIEDPGRVLTEEEAPGLWALVRDVAATMQTRSVDEIRITHAADLAVYERGGFRAKMNDSAERILILGAAVLNNFEQNGFRAVLAHEYGHFSNRDTAGGEIALRVNMDIVRVAESMGRSGTATFYNLGFQFLRLFHFLFRRITHGATRLQEIMADRVAAYNYGATAFRDGLSHVIRRELEFKHLARNEINAASSGNRTMANLYEMSVQEESALTDLDEQFQSVVFMKTTDDDTHPSPSDRFKYLEGIDSKEVEPLQGSVWGLFADRNAITLEMNSVIEKMVFANADE